MTTLRIGAKPALSPIAGMDPAYAAGGPPPPLTYNRFALLLELHGIDLELAAACFRRRFPNGPPTSRQLSDAERGVLFHEIRWSAERGMRPTDVH